MRALLSLAAIGAAVAPVSAAGWMIETVADMANHAIRRIDARTGLIETFASTGRPGDTPDGATIAGTPLRGPRSLDFDQAGHLWLATREGNQVFRFDPRAGRIHHVAGTGEEGDGPDGDPLSCKLARLHGLCIDTDGSVYIGDSEAHRIRVLRPRP